MPGLKASNVHTVQQESAQIGGEHKQTETDSGGVGSAVQTGWGKALQTMIHSAGML